MLSPALVCFSLTFCLRIPRPPRSTLFPYTTLFRSEYWGLRSLTYRIKKNRKGHYTLLNIDAPPAAVKEGVVTLAVLLEDRKSTRLNSSHSQISYAVFCLKKKTKKIEDHTCQQS